MTTNVEHIFMYLSTICIFSFVKLKSVAYILNFFFYWVVYIFHIFQIQLPRQIYVSKIFFLHLAFQWIFLKESFYEQKFLLLVKSIVFMCSAYEILAALRSQRYSVFSKGFYGSALVSYPSLVHFGMWYVAGVILTFFPHETDTFLLLM